MKQNPWRSRFLLLGALLMLAGLLTVPVGFIALLFGIYCIWYGLRMKPIPIPKHDPTPRQKTVSRPAPVRRPDVPDVPADAYQKRLKELADLETQADRKLASLTEYLNELFADSKITKDRYLSIVRKAEDITDVNLVKARDAISLFGDSPVTAQRLEILDGYVESSRQMLSRIDSVVTELMRAEQSHQLRSTQSIEEAMNELKETAKYYAQ